MLPPKLLYHFENLFISPIILNILTECLGPCALLSVVVLLPPSICLRLQTSPKYCGKPFCSCSRQPSSALHTTAFIDSSHITHSPCSCDSVPARGDNCFLQHLAHISSLENHLPKLGPSPPQELLSQEIEIIVTTNLH